MSTDRPYVSTLRQGKFRYTIHIERPKERPHWFMLEVTRRRRRTTGATVPDVGDNDGILVQEIEATYDTALEKARTVRETLMVLNRDVDKS